MVFRASSEWVTFPTTVLHICQRWGLGGHSGLIIDESCNKRALTVFLYHKFYDTTFIFKGIRKNIFTSLNLLKVKRLFSSNHYLTLSKFKSVENRTKLQQKTTVFQYIFHWQTTWNSVTSTSEQVFTKYQCYFFNLIQF